MSQTALETFTVSRRAADPRADGATRVVQISAEKVVIDRVVQGVRMRVAVPVTAYRELVLTVRLPSGTAALALRHDDSELDVELAAGEGLETARKARAWGEVLGKRIRIAEASAAMGEPIARRTKRPQPKRRSVFARRRKPGDPSRVQTIFAGEREIIART